MNNYYFTYGTSDTTPFKKGWSIVQADNRESAIALFRIVHPDHFEGLINCCSIYDEYEMKSTKMFKEGNFGVFTHEIISLNCKRVEGEQL